MKRKAPLLVTLVYAAAVGCGLMVLALPSHVETAAAVRGDAAAQRGRSIDAERRAFRAALLLLPWFAVLNPGNLGMGILAIALNVASVYALASYFVRPPRRRPK